MSIKQYSFTALLNAGSKGQEGSQKIRLNV